MEPFEIGVETVTGLKYFEVRPNEVGKNVQYEIWDDKRHVFSLECCFDSVGDSLKLSPEFKDKGIDPTLVESVADIIQSEEE
jgi:hypothetical protein